LLSVPPPWRTCPAIDVVDAVGAHGCAQLGLGAVALPPLAVVRLTALASPARHLEYLRRCPEPEGLHLAGRTLRRLPETSVVRRPREPGEDRLAAVERGGALVVVVADGAVSSG